MPGLFSTIIVLKAEQDAVISPTQGHHANALFLDLVRHSNPALADQLHRSAASKPYTASTLQGQFQSSGKNLKVISGSVYSFRLTFLGDEPFCYFMDAVNNSSKRLFRLENAVFSISRVLFNRLDSPMCNIQQSALLLSAAGMQPVIKLEFLSPTVFRSGGKRNVIFPEPSLVFGSYLNKWLTLAPDTLSSDLLENCGKIYISRYKLNTRILHFNGYQEVGFEGSCEYQITDDMNGEKIKAFNALADFAFYCGTGAKTTMGMGQTRRIYER